MKRRLLTSCLIVVCLVLTPIAGHAQGPTELELTRLKNEIQRRESVDRDNTILSEDKAINRANLEKAKSSLRTLLQSQIDAKTKLKLLLGSSATPNEIQAIEAALQGLTADLQQLQPNTSGSTQPSPSTAGQDTTNQPATSPDGSSPSSGPNSQTTLPAPAQPMNTEASGRPGNNSSPVGTTTSTISAGAATDVLPIRKCSDVAQNTASASNLERFFCAKVKKIEVDKHTVPTSIPGLDLRRDFFFFMIALLAREGRADYVVAAENERVDKQVSSDASSSGSTSLVTKGSVPAVLGFAVDAGALLKSTSGSTITFRGNVAGVAKALAGKGFISGYDEDSSAARFLRRTSFSFSFDPTRGNSSGVFTGNKQQISNYSFRMDLYNKRDARAPRYTQDWNSFLANQSQALSAQIQKSLLTLTDPSNNTWTDSDLQDWYVLTDKAMQAANTFDEIDAVLREYLNKAPKNLASTTLAELRSFDKRFKDWLDQRAKILDKIAKAPIVTFEYINDRPQNASSLSKVNFIAEGGFGPRLDLTFNGALTMFNQKPAIAGQGRVRDFQFAGQFDMPFGEIGLGLGKPVLSFAGRYERLMSNATTAAGTFAPNTKGDIGVAQVKLSIPIKNSGIRIPISFSFATRTELLKEKEKRGNFGFTFDPDILFALFKPFSK